MIPLKLTLEGIYSYQERQTIDFTHLTDAGLFGVFGQTGSGKSSVLEAVTYALYGETERMNNRDNRAYNMMNLKSDKLFLEFDFLNSANKKFRIAREIKRNRQQFEKTYPPTVNLYEEIANEWIPVEGRGIEDVLGLTYANFRRTIIIPQGQFKEFIELKPSERTAMLKEIFDLERFDLHDKTKTLHSENFAKLTAVKGELNAYALVTEEALSEQKQLQLGATKELKNAKISFEKINENYQLLKSQKSEFEDLAKKRLEFTKKEEKRPEFEQKEKNLNDFERISKTFKPLLERKKQIQVDFQKNQENNILKTTELNNETAVLEQKEKELKEIQEYFENIQQKRQEENDFLAIQQILLQNKKIKDIQEKSRKVKENSEQTKVEIAEIKEKLKNLEKEIQELEKQKLNPELLYPVGNWYNSQRNFKENLQKNENQITQLNTERLAETVQLKAFGVTLENYSSIFDEKLLEVKNQKLKAEKEKQNLEVQQKLAEYSHTLEDGSPCLLCGSVEHPEKLSPHDFSGQFQVINSTIQQFEDGIQKITSNKSKTEAIVQKIQFFEKQLNELGKEQKELLEQMKLHEEKFIWKEFDKNNESVFDKKRQSSLKVEKEITERNVVLKENRQKTEDLEVKKRDFDEELTKFTLEETECKTTLHLNLSALQILSFETYKNHLPKEIETEYLNLKVKNDEVEKKHKELSQIIGELKPKIAAITAELKSLENRKKEIFDLLDENQREIEKQLTLEKSTFLEIEEKLALNIDIEKTKNEIQEFKVAYETLKAIIQNLEQKLQNIEFNEAIFKEIEEKFKFYQQKVQENTENLAKIESEIARLEKMLKHKKELEKEETKYENRGRNIQVMLNLFSGSGFVNYISSIFLQQLCTIANERFHRMTRNQLTLIVNEKNEFEIIDFLNEGRTRSVKTLSGGQAFQVSLSLALALAESVQAKSKTKQNFFFIDEGFGTQDNEAVNLVFETLLNLNKENKIVGIISHVEELKERIPTSLTIIKDEERGSLIYRN